MCAKWWYIMYIQERMYVLCRSILQLPGIVHSVMGSLLQLLAQIVYKARVSSLSSVGFHLLAVVMPDEVVINFKSHIWHSVTNGGRYL